MSVQLDIYIEPDCLTCDYAYELADLVRDRLPEVEVRTIDLSQPDRRAPDNVFAVPTYVLNGQTWSLGNPEAERLMQQLQEMLRAE